MDIGELMKEWAAAIPEKVIHRVSPSQLGGCSRAHYYHIKHVPITTPKAPESVLNMQTGFMWEEIIKKSLDHAKVPYMYQLRLADEQLNMEGTIDFAIPTARGNGKIELEIWDSKTESMSAARYRKTNGETFIQSHADYTHQLNAYALLALRAGYEVTRGGYVVIQRDASKIATYPFEFDMESVKATLTEISRLNYYLKQEVVPACDGKYCDLGLCEYGNPSTAYKRGNNTAYSQCCGEVEELEEWRKDLK